MGMDIIVSFVIQASVVRRSDLCVTSC